MPPTRRRLLRGIAATTGGAVVGTATFAGSASATCLPRTPGYWATHDFPESALPGGGDSRLEAVFGVAQDQAAWQEFLLQPTRGDKAIILGQQLAATVLNFQYRTAAETDCVRQQIDDSDWTVEAVKQAATRWLAASAWPDGRQSSWVVTVDGEAVDGEVLKDILDAFNNDPSELGLDCGAENCGLRGGPDGDGPPGRN